MSAQIIARSRYSADPSSGPPRSEVAFSSPPLRLAPPLELVQFERTLAHSLDVDLRLDLASFEELLSGLARPAKVIPQLAAAFRNHTLLKP